jgi:hypothetical protein
MDFSLKGGQKIKININTQKNQDKKESNANSE